jgi:hypothetical protein
VVSGQWRGGRAWGVATTVGWLGRVVTPPPVDGRRGVPAASLPDCLLVAGLLASDCW